MSSRNIWSHIFYAVEQISAKLLFLGLSLLMSSNLKLISKTTEVSIKNSPDSHDERAYIHSRHNEKLAIL